MRQECKTPSTDAGTRLWTARQFHFPAVRPVNDRINLLSVWDKGVDRPSAPGGHKKEQIEP